MNISKKSWHYQLVLAFESGPYFIEHNLCPYFWQVVFAIIKAIGVFFVACVALTLLYLFLKWNLIAAFYWVDPNASFLAWGINGILMFVAARAIHDTMMETRDYETNELKPIPYLFQPLKWPVRQRVQEEAPQEVERTKSPFLGVVAAYLEALHDKVCPRLKFVDE